MITSSPGLQLRNEVGSIAVSIHAWNEAADLDVIERRLRAAADRAGAMRAERAQQERAYERERARNSIGSPSTTEPERT